MKPIDVTATQPHVQRDTHKMTMLEWMLAWFSRENTSFLATQAKVDSAAHRL